tara:strand:- start:1716 stop:2192 length:477 start_codon:yes stop_codon:yes gene_type:complete
MFFFKEFKHLYKSLFFFTIVLSFTAACQRDPVLKTHGIAYLEKREKLIDINVSNKNDIVKILGTPATQGLTNKNVWIYVERTRTRGKLAKLGRNVLLKNNILVLEFNDYGILIAKDFYDKDKMQKLKFDKDVTSFEGKKENFIYSFLSSVRQKMIKKK